MPHQSPEAQRAYFLAHKDKFREYAAAYYEKNKSDVNRRRIIKRIEAGGPVRMSTLKKYEINLSLAERTKILT